MAKRNQNELPLIQGNPLDWLWGRYQQRFQQRLLMGVISLILPIFLLSWLILLQVQASNYQQFLALWIIGHEVFILGFSIDHSTNVSRKARESGILPEVLLTGYSESEILSSLAKNLRVSLFIPFVSGVVLQLLILLGLQNFIILEGALLQLIGFLLVIFLPNGLLVISVLSLHLTLITLRHNVHPALILRKIFSLTLLSYYLIKSAFTIWILLLSTEFGHDLLSTLILCVAFVPVLIYPYFQLIRFRHLMLNVDLPFMDVGNSNSMAK